MESDSILNEELAGKATQILTLFKSKIKVNLSDDSTENFEICEEFVAYCEEFKDHVSESSAEPLDLAHELYMIAFLFWGNTDEIIIPFTKIPNEIKDAFLLIANQIIKWNKEEKK